MMGKCETIRSLLDIPVGKPEQRKINITRLGLTLTVKSLSYDKVMGNIGRKDASFHYILESTVSPNLRDSEWYENHMRCVTPVEALKKLLLPGEVSGLVKQLDQLNGYGSTAVQDVTDLQNAAVGAALEDLEKN